MRKFSAILFLCLFSFVVSNAQGLFEMAEDSLNLANAMAQSNFSINGYTKGLVYGGAKNFDFSNAFAELSLTTEYENGDTYAFADFRLREGQFFASRETQLQLKEAYAGYKGRVFNVFVGNQIVSWGRTDAFNPTNSITPNNYFLLTDEVDDQRLSNFLVRSSVIITTGLNLEFIVIPIYKPSVYRYDLFNLQQPVTFSNVENPDVTFSNVAVAAKASFEFPLVGFSLSYFNGYKPFYGFTVSSVDISTLNIQYTPKPYRKQAIGFDFDLPFRSIIFRGEVSLNLTNNYKENMHIPNPDVYYVAAIEQSVFGTTAILQLIGRQVLDYTVLNRPALLGYTPEDLMLYAEQTIFYESELYNRKVFTQQNEQNFALMLLLSRQLFYEVVSVDLAGYYNLTTEERLTRLGVSYSINDALTANFGVSIMKGPYETIFDLSGPVMNGAYIGVKASF